MSGTVSGFVATALVVAAVVLSLAAVRAWRRDTSWVRSRQRGPLDFVPIRTKAKRVHLGLRVAVIAALVIGALVTVAA